jgi:hypothetical protein
MRCAREALKILLFFVSIQDFDTLCMHDEVVLSMCVGYSKTWITESNSAT